MENEYQVSVIGPNGYVDFSANSRQEAIEMAEFLLAANDSVDVEIKQ